MAKKKRTKKKKSSPFTSVAPAMLLLLFKFHIPTFTPRFVGGGWDGGERYLRYFSFEKQVHLAAVIIISRRVSLVTVINEGGERMGEGSRGLG